MSAEIQEALNRIELLLTEIRDNTKPKQKRERTQLLGDGLPEIAKLWNEWASSYFPRVQAMDSSSARYKSCVARWKEHPKPDFWVRAINKINASDFCKGKNNRNWIADIEFLCRPDNCNKLLEGKYDNKEQAVVAEKKIHGYIQGADGQMMPVLGK